MQPRDPKLRNASNNKVKLLSGGNPQIPKGDADHLVQVYIVAMPGWKQDVGRRLDALIEQAVPEAEQCGWLKDRFGVSWQITPAALQDMMRQGTKEQIDRVTQAFLPMKRLDVAAIRAAYEGAGSSMAAGRRHRPAPLDSVTVKKRMPDAWECP